MKDRRYDDAITTGELREFVTAADTASGRTWNCLDLPTLVPEVPEFLRYVCRSLAYVFQMLLKDHQGYDG